MPDLLQCLDGQSINFLSIVAEIWGLDIDAPDAQSLRNRLVKRMTDKFLFSEMLTALPNSASEALRTLQLNNCKMPWTQFTRDFGLLRKVGSAKLEREKPHRYPVSAVEILWYRAMIGRAFIDCDGILQECVYIPDEFILWLPEAEMPSISTLNLQPAKLTDQNIILAADDQILDQVCTLLASQRRQQPCLPPGSENWFYNREHILKLSKSLELINEDDMPNAERARPWLEADRSEAFVFLTEGWLNSKDFNELRLVPSLKCEGIWQNDPKKARKALLEIIRQLPDEEWWLLEEFIKEIKLAHPDFQRSASEYDTWLIRSSLSEGLLIGQAYWFEVEGALIHYLITGPLHALGFTDLAINQDTSTAIAFRKSVWFEKLLTGHEPQGIEQESSPVLISSSGLIDMEITTPRIVRYQISRFCEWVFEKNGLFRYRLTPNSLKNAGEQGLKPAHLISLLRKHGKSPPPPSLVRAINHWETSGREAKIEHLCVLRVASPEIMAVLRQSPANRYLGDPLGPVSVIVQEHAIDKVMAALARLGYLADVQK